MDSLKTGFLILVLGLFSATTWILAYGAGNTSFDYMEIDRGHGHIEIIDVDNDGRNDIVKCGSEAEALVWFKHETNRRLTKHVIVKDKNFRGDRIAAGDIDCDGDVDLVSGLSVGDDYHVVWIENPLPKSEPSKPGSWTIHRIADQDGYIKDMAVVDFNGDGKPDVVTRANEQTVVFFQENPARWPQKVILKHESHEGMDVGDLDKDRDPDIVLNGFWYETPRKPEKETFKKHIFDKKWFTPTDGSWRDNNTSIKVADVNGDSLADILISHSELPGYPISIYTASSIEGVKTDNWKEIQVAKRFDFCQTLDAGDVDNDGDLDILAAKFERDHESEQWRNYQFLHLWRNDAIKGNNPRVKWNHSSSQDGDFPEPDVGRQAAALVFDIDKDGADDFVIAGWREETSMVWFRHTDQGWKRYLVDNRQSHIEAGGDFYDIDGDGDPDIVQGGSWVINEVWWWENPYPDFAPDKPWNRYTIKDWGQKQHHDQIFGDFDGDGKGELVFWNQQAKKLFITDVPDNPKVKENWRLHEIWSWPKEFKYEGFAQADVDLDGKTDLIGGGRWFKHLEGKRFKENIIDKEYGMSRSVAGDFIKGGRPEIVLNSGDGVGPLNLYEWKDNRWVKKTLIERVDHGHTLQAGDINGDGNLDIYAAEMHSPGAKDACKQWVLYGDGEGNFDIQVISVGIGTHEGRIGDLDGDGDLDILQKDFQHHQRVDIWINEG